MKLKDKTVVIIGASGGIGRSISLAFSLEDAELVLIGRRKSVLKALKRKISEVNINSNVYVYTLDVTNPGKVKKLMNKIGRKFGKIDILVNAAGIGIYKPFEKIKFDEWEKSLKVNVNAVFLTTYYLMPFLKKAKKSYVISLGSGMGKMAVAKRSAYCASKFALRGLMLSLAKEYKKTDIKFSLLTLGSVLTAFGPLSVEEKKKKKKKGKKYLEPSKVAHTLVEKIKNDTLESEVSIYPSDYYQESKKGKT